MKIFTTISVLVLSMFQVRSQSVMDIWDIKFYTVDSFRVDMAAYKGKTVLIATIDASKPDRNELIRLDSINRDAHSDIRVIGILVNDFGKPQKKDSLLKIIRVGEGLSFPITAVTSWRKQADKMLSHPIIQWLIESPGNKHFKIQLKEPDQIFLVNEKGILYAVLSGASLNAANKLNLVLNKNHAR